MIYLIRKLISFVVGFVILSVLVILFLALLTGSIDVQSSDLHDVEPQFKVRVMPERIPRSIEILSGWAVDGWNEWVTSMREEVLDIEIDNVGDDEPHPIDDREEWIEWNKERGFEPRD